MNVGRHKVVRIFCMVCVFACFAACSTPQKRAEENPEAFGRLTKSEQQLVLSGRVKEGLDSDAVYIALGRPSRVLEGSEGGQFYERWIYSRTVSEPVRYRRMGTYFIKGHGYYPYCYYDTYWDSYVVDTFEVTFRNGIVRGWREL